MSTPLRVGIAGLGTVGCGVVQVLEQQAGLLAQRASRPLTIAGVSARSRQAKRAVSIAPYRWYDDAVALAQAADVDVVVEVIGGADGIAKAVCEAALSAGKHLVTANKALLAHHGVALALQAEQNQCFLGYEAAVAGGIPVIKALCEGGVANQVDRVYGILNGTCNYILTTMAKTGRPFDDVLAEAQRLGYAEADPRFDVEGTDTAHKLTILASLAFGIKGMVQDVYCEGIRHITAADVKAAAQLGYAIKLLGMAARTPEGIEQRVHPCLVPLNKAISHVDDVFNAVVFDGDAVGSILLQGRGAGGLPTASSVVADIVDVAAGRHRAAFGVPVALLQSLPARPMAQHRGSYYLRLSVSDEAGVVANVAGALRDAGVSIRSLHQDDAGSGGQASVILVTHPCLESAVQQAISAIGAAPYSGEPPQLIRIETLSSGQQ